VDDEHDTVADEKRKGHPELLVRKHLGDGLSTLELPVDKHADADVSNNTDKKKDKDNNGKGFTAVDTRNELTTASLTLDGSSKGAAVIFDLEVSNSLILTTENVNLCRSASSIGAPFTASVLDGDTLALINTAKVLLSLKITKAHSGPETRTPADRRSGRADSGGITANVEISQITSITHPIKTVGELRIMIKGGQIILIFVTLAIRHSFRALIRISGDEGSNDQSNEDNGESLHFKRTSNTHTQTTTTKK